MKPMDAFAVQTASDNQVIIEAAKISTLTMSRDADPNLCMVTMVLMNGQGERNFRLHDLRAKELQNWLNVQTDHLQADHSNGMSVWINKSKEGKGPNIGNMLEAMLGMKTPGEARLEQQLMTLFATAREVKFSDDFIVDFTPMLMLVMKTIARAAAAEEIVRFKKHQEAAAFSKGQESKMADNLPPGIVAILRELAEHGDAITMAIDTQRRLIRNDDERAAELTGEKLSPLHMSDTDILWTKRSLAMKRMTDMACLVLGIERVKVQE